MTSQNTITLAGDLFEQMERRAAAEGKTPDELANELLGALMELREQADADDQPWRDLVTYGQGQADKLGIREEDVDGLIHEWRVEQRGGRCSGSSQTRTSSSAV